jgi:hypothetical protein
VTTLTSIRRCSTNGSGRCTGNTKKQVRSVIFVVVVVAVVVVVLLLLLLLLLLFVVVVVVVVVLFMNSILMLRLFACLMCRYSEVGWWSGYRARTRD